ncbi:MAG: hypothetical protein F4X20_01035 [Dehalococcoidia bacterium]|nr:hypothetical protein [Dehalococcoidia bacterium]
MTLVRRTIARKTPWPAAMAAIATLIALIALATLLMVNTAQAQSDTSEPVLMLGSVNGNGLTLEVSEALDIGSVPTDSVFVLREVENGTIPTLNGTVRHGEKVTVKRTRAAAEPGPHPNAIHVVTAASYALGSDAGESPGVWGMPVLQDLASATATPEATAAPTPTATPEPTVEEQCTEAVENTPMRAWSNPDPNTLISACIGAVNAGLGTAQEIVNTFANIDFSTSLNNMGNAYRDAGIPVNAGTPVNAGIPVANATPEPAGLNDAPGSPPVSQATPTPRNSDSGRIATQRTTSVAGGPAGCNSHRFARIMNFTNVQQRVRIASGAFSENIPGVTWTDDAPAQASTDGNTVIYPPYRSLRTESFTETVEWVSPDFTVQSGETRAAAIACHTAEAKRQAYLLAADNGKAWANATGMRIVVRPSVDVHEQDLDGKTFISISAFATVSGRYSVLNDPDRYHRAHGAVNALERDRVHPGSPREAFFTEDGERKQYTHIDGHKMRIPGGGDVEIHQDFYQQCPRGTSDTALAFYKLFGQGSCLVVEATTLDEWYTLKGPVESNPLYDHQNLVYRGTTYRMTGKIHQINLDGTIVFEVEVVPPPTFSTNSGADQSWTSGTAITNITVPAATSESAVTYSVVGSLPAGLSFSATTRVISGTPTTAGSGTITIRATNAGGTADWTVDYTIT